MKKNLTIMLVILTCLAMVLPACQSTNAEPVDEATSAGEEAPQVEEAEEPVTIRFWHTPGSGRPAGVAATIKAFNALYPHITVDTNEVAFPDMASSLQVAYAGDAPPDVALANGVEILNLAYNGALMPVDDVVSDEDRADFMPDLVDMVTLDGVMYGIPWEQAAVAMFYNVDYFEAVGIDVPNKLEDAWTWPEFKENVETAIEYQETEQGQKIWGMTSFQSPITGAFFTWTMVRSNSEPGSPLWESISPDFTTVSGYIDTPEAMEGYEFYQSLYTDEFSPTDNIPDAFGIGLSATYIAVPSIAGVLDKNFPDLNWGVLPVPYFKTQFTHTGSFAPVVAVKTENPEEAKLFAAYFSSKEGQLAYYEATKILPGRISLREELPELQGDGIFAFWFNSAVEQGVARPGGPAHSIFNKVIAVDMFKNIALGGEIKEVVASAIAEADAQLAQFGD